MDRQRDDIVKLSTVLVRAAQIHPDNVVVRTLRGKALLMCGQYEAALEVGTGRLLQIFNIIATQVCLTLGRSSVVFALSLLIEKNSL